MDCLSFLQNLSHQVPSDLKPRINEFQTLYDRKLWHTLSEKLVAFFKVPSNKPFLHSLYEGFIKHWEEKLNPLVFVELASILSENMPDKKQALEFLIFVMNKVQHDNSAYSYVLTLAGQYQLELGDAESATLALEKSQTLLEGRAGLDYKIHASHYHLAAKLDQLSLNYSSYYKNGLSFVAVMPLSEWKEDEIISWARDLCIAALLGDKTYHFGDLLHVELIKSLDGTPFEWLKSLIEAFHIGDMSVSDSLLTSHTNEAIINSNLPFLKQKQCLMALVEFVFSSSPLNKQIAFNEIAKATKLPLFEVEILVMKAISLGMIKGRIDQVEEKVTVEWIQPRILNLSQIGRLRTRVGEWKERADAMLRLMMSETSDWLVPV